MMLCKWSFMRGGEICIFFEPRLVLQREGIHFRNTLKTCGQTLYAYGDMSGILFFFYRKQQTLSVFLSNPFSNSVFYS